ncbi:hypothetical protein FW320_33010, partial [Azospirillum sp. Vi22]|nr:hypothetical protein [Azospirillum baldaniorum]
AAHLPRLTRIHGVEGARPVPTGRRAGASAAINRQSSAAAAASHTYEELQKQIDDLQKQIASIAKPARPAKPEGK